MYTNKTHSKVEISIELDYIYTRDKFTELSWQSVQNY